MYEKLKDYFKNLGYAFALFIAIIFVIIVGIGKCLTMIAGIVLFNLLIIYPMIRLGKLRIDADFTLKEVFQSVIDKFKYFRR